MRTPSWSNSLGKYLVNKSSGFESRDSEKFLDVSHVHVECSAALIHGWVWCRM